jgi:HSP20 family molecular chaperone IbpA
MNTIIHHLDTRSSRSRAAEPTSVDFRHPNYDCREQDGAVRLVVYVPGVDPSGVEITASGPDLVVTARKSHFIRTNFRALHLEAAQKDYLLKLRLGKGLDYAKLNAEIRDGILTITVPKLGLAGPRSRLGLAA